MGHSLIQNSGEGGRSSSAIYSKEQSLSQSRRRNQVHERSSSQPRSNIRTDDNLNQEFDDILEFSNAHLRRNETKSHHKLHSGNPTNEHDRDRSRDRVRDHTRSKPRNRSHSIDVSDVISNRRESLSGKSPTGSKNRDRFDSSNDMIPQQLHSRMSATELGVSRSSQGERATASARTTGFQHINRNREYGSTEQVRSLIRE